MSELENSIDEEHAKELIEMRATVSGDMRTDLEKLTDELVKKLEEEGECIHQAAVQNCVIVVISLLGSNRVSGNFP